MSEHSPDVRENSQKSVDWSAVRRLCEALGRDVDSLSNTVTDAIRASWPSYAVVPREEHSAAVEQQLSVRLAALAERRHLTESELQGARALAATRATQGIPIGALIAAYQSGDQAIWREVREGGGEELIGLLPDIATLVFESTSATTAVMATAHDRVARAIDGDRIALAYEFFEFLGSDPSSVAAAVSARRVGFEPASAFLGLVWEGAGSDLTEVHEAVTQVRATGSEMVGRVGSNGAFEMLVQSSDPASVLMTIKEQDLPGCLGLGVTRPGIPGAAQSLADARMAVLCTTPGRPVMGFDECWPEALVLTERGRLSALVNDALAVARSHPHLAEAVIAFAGADMSITATALQIHLHANSVTYRLERWAEKTNLDPRTFDGLTRSLAACRLAAHAGDDAR